MSPPTQTSVPRLLLVVDDDDDIREVATTALELVSGYRVVTATNGLDAVVLARQQHPDAILLDVMMPVLGGLETVVRLKDREETAHIPVILLTASVGDCMPKVDVVGMIPKPFDPMLLGTEVERMLGWTP